MRPGKTHIRSETDARLDFIVLCRAGGCPNTPILLSAQLHEDSEYSLQAAVNINPVNPLHYKYYRKMGTHGDDVSIQLSEVESIDVLSANDLTNRGFANDSSREDISAQQLSRREYQALFFLKLSVMGVLVTAAVALSVSAYFVTAKSQNDDFVSEYEGYATKIVNGFYEDSALRVWTAQSISASFTSEFGQTKEWPFVTLANFSRRTAGLSYIAKAKSIVFAPLVTNETRAQWEQYAIDNWHLIQDPDHVEANETAIGADGTSTGGIVTLREDVGVISRSSGNATIPAEGPGPFFPIWEVAPMDSRLLMIDLASSAFIKNQLQVMIEERQPSLSKTGSKGDHILCTLLFPVFEDFSPNAPAAGVISLSFDWATFFSNTLPLNAVGLYAVLSNTCGQAFTFMLNGPDVTFIGEGDSHDTEYDDLVYGCDFGYEGYNFAGAIPHFSNSNITNRCGSHETFSHGTLDATDACVYSMHVYPSDHLKDSYSSSEPAIYTAVIALIFVFTSIVFLAYDFLIERRQQDVLKTAARSNAIVHALFPAVVRDRIFRDSENNDDGQQPRLWGTRAVRRNSDNTIKSGTIANVDGVPAMQSINSSQQSSRDDDMSGKRALLPMLPETPKIRLKSYLIDAPNSSSVHDFDSEPIAEMFTDTTIMFADISGFTAWSSEREPSQVFILLETLYRAFDAAAHRLGVFKVETIGDCYVAVAGLPDPNEHHAVIMTYFAYECIRKMKELTRKLEATLGPGTSDLCMRVGLHSGPVTAGVLRGEKSRFQLFGDSVNTAARMESTGETNLIHASKETADLLMAAGKFSWVTARDDVVVVKGKGEMNTFWLKPRRGSSRGSSQAYLMDNSSCASSTIDSRPRHRILMPNRALLPPKVPQKNQTTESISGCSTSSPLPNFQVDSKKWGNLSLDEALTAKATVSSQKKASQKRGRLVDWNVDLLLSFLSKVVANRDDPTAIQRCRDFLDDDQFVTEKSPMILSEVTEVIILPDFDNGKNMINQADVILPPEVREQLHDYVTRVASMYRENPFHNLEHASHVTMSAVKLMRRIINPDDNDSDTKEHKPEEEVEEAPVQRLDTAFYKNLHQSTFGISSDPLTQFSVVYSALIHVSAVSSNSNRLSLSSFSPSCAPSFFRTLTTEVYQTNSLPRRRRRSHSNLAKRAPLSRTLSSLHGRCLWSRSMTLYEPAFIPMGRSARDSDSLWLMPSWPPTLWTESYKQFERTVGR